MTLQDTKDLMVSADYKERFKAEYWQNRIRLEKLNAMLEKWGNGTLDFTPTCPRDIYTKQTMAMTAYIDVLEERAKIEEVNL